MSMNEMSEKIRELKELEALIKQATAEADAIKDSIKAEMAAKGTEVLNVDIYTVRYQTITSNRFDTKAFQKTHGELYDQYVKPTVSTRFTVA